MIKENKYFYVVNYPQYEKELCKLEIKSLFNLELEGKTFFSKKYITLTRSPFIKESLAIIYEEESLDKIIENIKRDNLSYKDFKVCYIRLDKNEISYEERLNAMRKIGLVINGEPDMKNPKITLGVICINNKWFFGEYEKNDFKWHIHDSKPCSYSNSLSGRIARALVNIAVCDNLNTKLIDPCCGVGTVVIEGLSMGVDIKGVELRLPVARDAKRNLKFFGYDDCITCKDMRDIKEKYDAAIIDLPYGLFTPTTLKEQTDIINYSRKIVDKLVLITFEDMDEYIKSAGFKIIDSSFVCKGNFKRFVRVCI